MTLKTQMTASLILTGVMLLLPLESTTSQSLGEVARQYRKERNAREKKGEIPVKVFTNDDVSRTSTPATTDSSKQSYATSTNTVIREHEHSGPHQAPATERRKTPAKPSNTPPGKAQDFRKSKEYWQARFSAAWTALAKAKEEQALVEDELQLLEVQQARELDPGRSRKLNSRIDARTVELEAKRAATEKAQSVLDETKKEFKKSGDPLAWIQNQ